MSRKSGDLPISAAAAQRAERLAAALRENLKRRKAQARGRARDSLAGTPEGQGAASSATPPAAPHPDD
jgi:hypothetical protein